jgi:hypothetical protein
VDEWQALVPGTILVFDGLLHYPGWERNEALALWEWLGKPGEEEELEGGSGVPVGGAVSQAQEENAVREVETVEGVEVCNNSTGGGSSGRGAGTGVGAVRWVCAKDKVMPLEQCRRDGGSAVTHHRRMIAQSYDQSAAALVLTVPTRWIHSPGDDLLTS